MADPLETPDIEDKYVDPTGSYDQEGVTYPAYPAADGASADAAYSEVFRNLHDNRKDKVVPVTDIVPPGAHDVSINDEYARYSMTVGTTPVKVANRNVGRLKIWIQNNGTDFVAFGGPDVGAATDLRIVPGATMTDDVNAYTDEIWCVANSGSQAIVVRDESRH